MNIVCDLNYEITPKARAIALGFFDGVHLGHIAVLRKVVGLKKDGLLPSAFTFIMDNKIRPSKKQNSLAVQSIDERSECMENVGIEEVICPKFESFMNLSPKEFIEDILIKKFNAKVISCGENFHFGKGAGADITYLKNICEKNNVKLIITHEVTYKGFAISSSRIRKAVKNGNMPLVKNLLGRFYSIHEKVIHGAKLGRKLGFPTINQSFDEGHTIPKFGVYATIITLQNGQKYIGATNVGIKPTVGSDKILAETYILNCNLDLYDTLVTTEFVKFIRPEHKFENIDLLSNAIRNNAKTAFAICSTLI